MSIKPKIEAIIYAAEDPVSLEHITGLLKEAVVSEEGTTLSDADIKARVRAAVDELVNEYAASGRAMEIRQVAGGYRMATKPEHHDVVRAFAKSLKPPVRLSLPALETLAVIAYKQPVTVPEISEIRGVDSSGVIATLLERKLVTTAGRKAVIGRPILYKTTKEFLLRFGLKDVSELPSMEEFEKLASEALQLDMAGGVADVTGVPDLPESQEPTPVAEAEPQAMEASPAPEEPVPISEGASEPEIVREEAAGD
ncbi:MAG TPA: SMC-Scp complex subunit ScpB [Terriglobales bacterium]|nr:SMC-Scp complex subunit ScpB [Terriglobales bacterium]